MDLVEAIDAWIDETIDDLSDDELESILEILDAVSDSQYSNLDADDVYDDDIEDLVELVGGDSNERAHTDLVLRQALFGERQPSGLDDDTQDNADKDTDADNAESDDQQDERLELDQPHGEMVDDLDEVNFDEANFDDLVNATDDVTFDADFDALTDFLSDESDDALTFEAKSLSDDVILGDLVLSDLDSDDLVLSDLDSDDLDLGDLDSDDLVLGDLDSDDLDLGDLDSDDLVLGDPYGDDLVLGDPYGDDLDLGDFTLGRPAPGPMDSDAIFLGDLVSAQTSDLPFGQSSDAHDDFLADVTQASQTAELARPVVAAPLRPFDELGPAFLPTTTLPTEPQEPERGVKVGHIVLPFVLLIGLAAFGFGMIQLINSLDEPDTNVALSAEVTAPPTAVPTPLPAPAEPTEEADDAQAANTSPAATPVPETDPEPRLGIRLVTGDVMLATFNAIGEPPTFVKLYDASGEDDSPARQIAWLDDRLGIIDNDGNVLVVEPGENPDDEAGKAELIYEATGGLAEAAGIVSAGDLIAIRTVDGDINLTPADERADPDILRVAWDAEEEGALAIDIGATGDLVQFVLDNGDARMIETDDDDSIVSLWKADPKPPAYNLIATEQGVLMGIGEGTISRYRLGDVDGSRLESIWNPQAGDEDLLPAAGYSAVGDQTAVVLVDGGILLVDDDGDTTPVWNAAETEIRAFSVAGDESHVLVLLETGSIVRIPLDPDEFIESIWDITDETLSAANQLAIEPLN